MAKGSNKVPGESKCRGSQGVLEGRDWVRIGGNKWLREVAEKQGKYIPLEYREQSGSDVVKRREETAAAKEQERFEALMREAEEELNAAREEAEGYSESIVDEETAGEEVLGEMEAPEAIEEVEV